MFIALCGSLLWLSGLMGQAPTSQRVDSLTVAGIMRDPAWIGHAPEDIRWSLDGKEIYFQWNPAPVPGDSLYVVSPNGGKPTPVPVALRDQLPPIDPARSPDGRQLVYALRGDLYLSPAGELQPQPLTQTLARERNPQFDLAGERIFFEAEDNLFALHLATGLREQLTDFRPGKASEASDLSTRQDQRGWLARQEGSLIQYVGKEEDPEDPTEDRPLPYYHGSAQPEALTISPDGRFVTFRLRTNHAGSDRTQVPDYISASGYTETLNARPKVGSGQATFEFGIYDREQDTVRLLETAQIPGISDTPSFFKEYQTSTRSEGIEAVATPRPVMVMGPTWSVDSRHAVVEIRSLDFKDRWLMRLEAASGQLSLLDRQHDEAWIGGPGIPRWQGQLGDQGWLPDHETYWFMSEETGYAHLYTVNVTTGKRRPMTGGSYEVFDVRVGQKGKYWYFNASQVHPGERQFYRLPIDGGVAEQLTSLSGHHEVSLSPDEKTLAIRYSTSNQPWELWVQPNRPGAKPKQLTHSVSEAFEAYPWRAPDLITIPASDGARIHARLYRPSGTAAADKAVIFVHGAGYLQNAHKWWSSYFREYMFHNLLADQGYVVLDIDYRGSAGYGRDWRTEVYRHMGGTDLSDHLDARRFLIDELQVDSTRIGIYGGSYGGFITLMAMFTAPGAFAAGAALRPVTDWAHYNHPYTASMLNQPQDDSLAYHRSSPIYFAEGLTGALLICHGMVDTNVHFQDVVRLNQRLIELGKRNWQVAMYPVEGHGFTEPSSWTDEYRRIYELFEENIGEKTLR
jgi:dipeptidyl aminopeptidase/acylaminoacyl peptidase